VPPGGVGVAVLSDQRADVAEAPTRPLGRPVHAAGTRGLCSAAAANALTDRDASAGVPIRHSRGG
jgi:hypothetical protein